MTNEFFPYSQQKLGFDKPVTIIFQSDEENSSKMLGKTAFYNPDTFEVVLYTDNRHPKDILRSLSHELVHHNQNCRGDFTGTSQTVDGYAQIDPHLRKMEREAYTKGNLIFRDFEDLIKTGKINIEIDFSNSGEPKMSLKEWKDNEINTKLMKKWGFLKESKEVTTEDTEELEEDHEHGPECGCPGQELEEGWGFRKEDDKDLEEGGADYRDDDDLEEGWAKVPPDDETDVVSSPELDRRAWAQNKGPKVSGKKLDDPRARPTIPAHQRLGKKSRPATPGSRNVFTTEGKTSGKISVREAKEITRRIIERIKKESK